MTSMLTESYMFVAGTRSSVRSATYPEYAEPYPLGSSPPVRTHRIVPVVHSKDGGNLFTNINTAGGGTLTMVLGSSQQPLIRLQEEGMLLDAAVVMEADGAVPFVLLWETNEAIFFNKCVVPTRPPPCLCTPRLTTKQRQVGSSPHLENMVAMKAPL